MNSVTLWVGVGAFGGLASIARFVVHGLFPRDSDAGFPVGTLAVNLSGSFLLGLLAGAGVARDAYLLGATAALGSYTTFSTWILDSERLARHELRGRVAANLIGSLVLGVAAVELGRLVAGG